MKTYGETRRAASCEDFATNSAGDWRGTTRKIARRRAADKKILHRRARRTWVDRGGDF